MSSPHTFFGKVGTLLIGSALSWFTVTNAQFSDTIDALIGNSPATAVSEQAGAVRLVRDDHVHVFGLEAPSVDEPLVDANPSRTHSEPVVPEVHGLGQIDELATQLRHLGATYLLLEKLPNPNGDQYRVRCDLARQASRVKCCFEATRETAEAAMHDVLQAVLNVDSRHGGLTASVVSSS